MRFRLIPFATALLVLAAGCATPDRLQVPEQLPLPPTEQSPAEQVLQAGRTSDDVLRQSATPRLPTSPYPDTAGLDQEAPIPPGLDGPPIGVNVNNLPLPAFANEVLGDMLGQSIRQQALGKNF